MLGAFVFAVVFTGGVETTERGSVATAVEFCDHPPILGMDATSFGTIHPVSCCVAGAVGVVDAVDVGGAADVVDAADAGGAVGVVDATGVGGATNVVGAVGVGGAVGVAVVGTWGVIGVEASGSSADGAADAVMTCGASPVSNGSSGDVVTGAGSGGSIDVVAVGSGVGDEVGSGNGSVNGSDTGVETSVSPAKAAFPNGSAGNEGSSITSNDGVSTDAFAVPPPVESSGGHDDEGEDCSVTSSVPLSCVVFGNDGAPVSDSAANGDVSFPDGPHISSTSGGVFDDWSPRETTGGSNSRSNDGPSLSPFVVSPPYSDPVVRDVSIALTVSVAAGSVRE